MAHRMPTDTASTSDSNTPAPAVDSKPQGVLRSVIANWATETVMVVSGFVLPRLIQDGMGTARLGVWDFGWLVRSYIDMSVSSVGSGAGYYVSSLRASGRVDDLNRKLGAMFALTVYAALIGAVITGIVAWFTPALVNTPSGELILEARWLALFIGLAACLATPALVFGGVLVGCRRFDLLNWVDGLCHVFVVVTVIACVLLGAGLKIMGLCLLARETLNLAGRWRMARRVLPEWTLRPRWFDREAFADILGYSGKTVLDALSKFLQNQVSAVFLSSFVGPAAVAVLSRSRSLILITTRFVMGFARVLVPRAGALHAQRDQKGLSDLLIRSTRMGLFVSLPPALVMLILGSPLLRVWMGDAIFAESHVLPILVIGYLPLLAQQATYHVLIGTASHGTAGVASMLGAGLSALLAFLFVVVLKWDVTGAALAMAIPVALVNLFVVPFSGCRAVGLSMRRYLQSGLVGPLVSVLPFAALLLLGRFVLGSDPKVVLFGSLMMGLPALAVVYWRVALPPHVKKSMRTRLGMRVAPLTSE